MTVFKSDPPLILITNDDGIGSPGLLAAARAVEPLGEILIVAPHQQSSGAGRSMPPNRGRSAARIELELAGRRVAAYSLDASPAMTVVFGILKLASRQPDLLISGINYGENMGSDVTSSGTVGAALQGAIAGIPSLAISLQTPKEMHHHPTDGIDFSAAMGFTRRFAKRMLKTALPFDVDVLKIDVPDDATPETPWRLTRASRYAFYVSVNRKGGAPVDNSELDYWALPNPEQTERDSDIYAVAVDRVVAVTPLSLDLTSRADWGQIKETLCGPAIL